MGLALLVVVACAAILLILTGGPFYSCYLCTPRWEMRLRRRVTDETVVAARIMAAKYHQFAFFALWLVCVLRMLFDHKMLGPVMWVSFWGLAGHQYGNRRWLPFVGV